MRSVYHFLWLASGIALLWVMVHRPAAAFYTATDAIWDDRFGLSSVEYGSVRALVVDGDDLYIGGSFTSTGGLPANNVAHWDGRRWRALDMGISGAVHALAVYQGRLYAGGDFTQAGTVAVNGIAVWDGVHWDALNGGSGVLQDGYKGIVRVLAATEDGLYIGGDFTHINGMAAFDIARWDGRELTPLGEGLGDLDYNGNLSYTGGVFALTAAPDGSLYVGGDFAYAGNQQPLLVNSLARWRWQQKKWEAVDGGVTKLYGKGEVRSLAVREDGDLFVGGQFVKAGNLGVSSIARWDGRRWDDLDGGLGFDSAYSYVNSMALVDDILYVGGGMTSIGGQKVSGLAVWDGNTWAGVGGGLRESYEGALGLAVSDNVLYVAGAFSGAGELFSRNLVKWTGVAWEALGQGVGYGSVVGWVEAVAVDQDGLVYVGGHFDRVAGRPTRNLAVWDGTRWAHVGEGANGSVYALAAYGPLLYVGGDFTQAGGMAAAYIAQYNSITGRWSALGSGLNGYVYALAVAQDGTLFVGGDFTGAGDANVRNVARWDGMRWSGLGAGIAPNGVVRALAWDGRLLYMGGAFSRVTEAGQETTVNGLLVWDSQTDGRYLLRNGDAVGVTRRGSFGDFAGMVYTLAVTDRALYVGGVFDKAGGVAASGVAAFDFRSGWQALGSGVSSMYTPSVYALTAVDNQLYVGGDFSAAGRVKTTGIARWDSVQDRWHLLDEGLSPDASVKALTYFDGSLYVGGHFVSAGGAPAAAFSRWGPATAQVEDHQGGAVRPTTGQRDNGFAGFTRTPTATPVSTRVSVPTRVNLTPTITPTATQIITPMVTWTRTPTPTPCPTTVATRPASMGSGTAPCDRTPRR